MWQKATLLATCLVLSHFVIISLPESKDARETKKCVTNQINWTVNLASNLRNAPWFTMMDTETKMESVQVEGERIGTGRVTETCPSSGKQYNFSGLTNNKGLPAKCNYPGHHISEAEVHKAVKELLKEEEK